MTGCSCVVTLPPPPIGDQDKKGEIWGLESQKLTLGSDISHWKLSLLGYPFPALPALWAGPGHPERCRV